MFHSRPRVVSTGIILKGFIIIIIIIWFVFCIEYQQIYKNIDTVSEILLSMVASLRIAHLYQFAFEHLFIS